MPQSAPLPPKENGEASGDDFSGDVTAWLKEVGKRVRAGPARGEPEESAEALLDYLREVTGRPLRTRDDILDYFQALHREQIAAEQALSRRRRWRESVLLFLAVGAYLHYYYWDVSLEIVKLPQVVATVPAKHGQRIN